VLGDKRTKLGVYSKQARLGQVRKAIKSSIIGPHLLLISVFQNSEKTSRKGVTHDGLGDERTD
jgi:hypothetical protein